MGGRQHAVAVRAVLGVSFRATMGDGSSLAPLGYLGLPRIGVAVGTPGWLALGVCRLAFRRPLVAEQRMAFSWPHRALSSEASSGGKGRGSDEADPVASADVVSQAGGASRTGSGSTRSEAYGAADGAVEAKRAVQPAGSKQPAPLERKPGESIESLLARKTRHDLQEQVGPAVERYLPAEDPQALLLPPSRLTPAERVWQRVFVALPWAVFACMLATPLFLLRANLPFLQRRAEDEREAAAERSGAVTSADVLPEFNVVAFAGMPDILERRVPTLVLLFDPATLASKIWVPAFRDLATALRESGVAVCVSALDLSASPRPPDTFLTEYPAALSPHLQLVLPRASDGEAGVLDYTGPWTVDALTQAARKLAGPRAPELAEGTVEHMEVDVHQLRDSLFEFQFVDEVFGGPDVEIARQRSVWRLFGSGKDSGQAKPEQATRNSAEVLAELERDIDLAGGVEAACASVKKARAALSRQ